MLSKLDKLAHDAGFRKAGEIQTSNVEPVGSIGGIEIFESPLLPEGWAGLKSGNSLILISPDGNVIPITYPWLHPTTNNGKEE